MSDSVLSSELREKIAATIFNIEHPRTHWKIVGANYHQDRKRDYYRQAASSLWFKIKQWEKDEQSE